ncbi:nibrin-like isoform X1 [Bradysia coprophila]|uniref:nibrin-like isoform X1 n=1 Tax=Bradysia coprophila TaxID=38358 RepID=UPI00187DCF75|nr:nibrin-like isoform X1 [Bradysia coprophila]
MWILSRVNNEDKVYLLCDKPHYTVGRNKTCDIVGEQTQSSLGRFHATLHPYEDRVEIIDTESKYGTYINEQINSNVRIDPKVPVLLKDGDTIRFGFIDFTWKLEKVDIVVLTSTLNEREKNNLKRDITTLGGQFVDQWSDTCTHLVVKSLTLTVKVLQGLCHAIPIVKPDYFRAMLSSIRSNGTMPKVEMFQPAIVERVGGNTWSMEANIDRKRLFVGKTFVFMNSRQMETFKGIIECAMGKCSSLDTKKWQRRSLVNPGVIVISDSSGSTQSQVAVQTANELNDFLISKGSRMVPDSEISLAILHCSLNKFCNPNHTLKDNFESKPRTVPSKLLANDTPANQNGCSATPSTSSINVPETIDQPNTLASTVPSNSEIIELMDDDDDAMLIQSVDFAMSMEEVNNKKRKNSSDIEERSVKKRNLNKSAESDALSDENSAPDESSASSKRGSTDKSVASTTKASQSSDIPQRSTRSASKIQSFSKTKHGIESPIEGMKNQSAKLSTASTTKGLLDKNTAPDESATSSKRDSSDKSLASATRSNQSLDIPQRSARSASKIQNFSTTEHVTESRKEVIEGRDSLSSKPSFTTKNTNNQHTRTVQQSGNKRDSTEKNSETFPTEISIIQGSQMQSRAANNSQPKWTSTQIDTPSKRKRTAHRGPTSSIFGGNDSDSDDDLFKFNNEPSVKKSRPAKGSDSDSDDNRNYPRSSGPVAPIPMLPPMPITQPQSQIAPDSWLSRPALTQTFTGNTTIRSRPRKRNDRADKAKSNNVSTGWQIGQFCISTPPVPIPTQGWCSKDTIKSASLENDMKQEDSKGKSMLEASNDSLKCGIQVITKSMNLMSTSGKVFKKQSFIVPSEIIKTTKIYEF